MLPLEDMLIKDASKIKFLYFSQVHLDQKDMYKLLFPI